MCLLGRVVVIIVSPGGQHGNVSIQTDHIQSPELLEKPPYQLPRDVPGIRRQTAIATIRQKSP